MKKKAHTFLFLCFLCLCLTLSARAEGADQPEIVTLETIIVTADRLPQPIAKSTSSVTLITKKEITEKHPTLPDEILRGMPGLSVNCSAPWARPSPFVYAGATAIKHWFSLTA